MTQHGGGPAPASWYPWIWAGLVATLALWVFFPILVLHPSTEIWALAEEWENDPNYSYGYLIAPLALFFIWERRELLTRLPARGSALGLAVIALALLVFLGGMMGGVYYLTRISVVILVPGIVAWLVGWQRVRAIAFPLLFLALMVPPPYFLWAYVAAPLQEFAAVAAEKALFALEVPVLRTGNVISLANTDLEVAEACSGLRSLLALVTTGIVFGYFFGKSALQRVLVVLSSVPIAILVNAARVAGTGWLAYHYGADVAQGYYHEFEGFGMFLLAFGLLSAVGLAVVSLVPDGRGRATA
jgi:exosortase